MRICAITLGDSKIRSYSKYSFEINQSYCTRHGYCYIQYNDTIDKTRPPAWSKILAIKDQIDNFDWIFYIDADAIFFNHDIKIESFIDVNFNMIISEAVNEQWVKQYYSDSKDFLNINSGSFLIKGKNIWSKFLLDYIYSKTNRIDHHFWENQSLIDIILEQNPIINKKIKLLKQKELNGFEQDMYCYSDFSVFQYIIHYAGMSAEDREFFLKKRHQEFLSGKFTGDQQKNKELL